MSTLDTTAHFNRPAFDPRGRVVGREGIKLGKLYTRGEIIPRSVIQEQRLSDRDLAKFWDLGLIDTLPLFDENPLSQGEPGAPAQVAAPPEAPSQSLGRPKKRS